MDYPIHIAGRRQGTLTERQEGLYTLLLADCERQPGLVRLWLRGREGSAYLGLLCPQGDRMVLQRRLSRRERAALPAVILSADDGGSETAVSGSPAPRAAPAAEDWVSLPDGSLLSGDGRRAIPAQLPADSPLAGRLRRIGGRDYLVFRL